MGMRGPHKSPVPTEVEMKVIRLLWNNYSIKEISFELGQSLNTIYKILYKARKRMYADSNLILLKVCLRKRLIRL